MSLYSIIQLGQRQHDQCYLNRSIVRELIVNDCTIYVLACINTKQLLVQTVYITNITVSTTYRAFSCGHT